MCPRDEGETIQPQASGGSDSLLFASTLAGSCPALKLTRLRHEESLLHQKGASTRPDSYQRAPFAIHKPTDLNGNIPQDCKFLYFDRTSRRRDRMVPMFLLMVVVAAVRAQDSPVYPDGSIRLVGGRNPTEGNVEVFYRGRWGSICDDEWDIREAYIVCKMLGYNRAVRATFNSQFGRGRDLIWMDNMFCTGREFRLDRCRFDGWGVHDCNHAEAAGVVCDGQRARAIAQGTPEISPNAIPAAEKTVIRLVTEKDLAIRLVGGRTTTEGRVEVRMPQGWGLICGDGWGITEANVVCNQLRLGHAKSSVQSGTYGGHHKNMIVSGVTCKGSEHNLADCVHDKMGQVFCPGEENIAGVVCSAGNRKDVHRQHSKWLNVCPGRKNYSSFHWSYDRTRPGWQYLQRRVLRFTARIGNFGTTDFRPFLPKQSWQWHACHLHYHSMEVFAHFDIIDSRGTKVAEGHKASFCLEDNECHTNIPKKYACANYGDQGISVGCVDTYHHNIDCQWVDITDLRPGTYYFKVSVNPELKVSELSYDNNAATCIVHFDYVSAQVYNCTLGRP
ncbi:Lysyl oxidase 3A [Araneus ventricosus]|uniref:protein-lysine 6-oxidase n=1 Tax=Araneus ventricosus TaxID=182803 RepID=A0A4Y2J4Q3_ARAVE|nr:Lysyl oxidase 3A [Araneus ventricosus]